MNNPVRLNYAWERTHTAMVAYLCLLWNNPEYRAEIGAVLNALGIPLEGIDSLTPKMEPRLEHSQPDLAVLGMPQGHPIALFEVKVDSSESGPDGDGLYETQRMAAAAPRSPRARLVYLTLGLTSLAGAPRSNEVRHVRIECFLPSLRAVALNDPYIRDWTKELEREADFLADPRDKPLDGRWRGNYSCIVLGHLASYMKDADLMPATCDPHVYKHGRGPDQILNFGWYQDPMYMEINHDGLLNLKIRLDQGASDNAERVRKARQQWQSVFPEAKLGASVRARAKSATVLKLPSGLIYDRSADHLTYPKDMEKVARAMSAYLYRFYGRI